MNGKIKTSIVVDKYLWEKFKAKVSVEKGLKKISEAIEDIIKEDLSETIIANELEKMLSNQRFPSVVKPVKPRVRTNAGAVLRELRDTRT